MLSNMTRPLHLTNIEIEVTRENPTRPIVYAVYNGERITTSMSVEGTAFTTHRFSEESFDVTLLMEALDILARCLYVGPFRNIINVGGGKYYDLPIGSGFRSGMGKRSGRR
jgi:hypothetical protein